MADLFTPAPAVLAAVFLLSLLAPSLTARLGRRALLGLAVAPAAMTVWFAALLPQVLHGQAISTRLDWIPALSLTLDLRLDALAAVLCLVITGIGTLVLAYSARYFPPEDDGLPKYAGSLLAFAASMVALVLADNLILLVVFWELTGILSYLLIAHRVRTQSSRAAAGQALMVTTAGGLAMLMGAVLLGVQAGTFRLSEVIVHPPSGAATTAAVVLLLVGGISKSAIVPFQFWLPGAMAAPTPATAYLHAATMVKAGVYLFARLAPAFAALPVWRPMLLILGGATMLYGGLVALRQRDLKLLLAYGTVSQLGLLTLLAGSGNPDALLAAVAMLIGHATFKGALFFVVGIIDTSTGTRDLTRLSGLGRRMPVLAVLAGLSALSMAGLPPMIGFAAKEAGFAGLLAGGSTGVAAAAVMAAGSVFTVAYSIRFCWGAFASKPGVAEIRPARTSGWMTVPTAALVAAGLLFGIAPRLLEGLVQSYADTAGGARPGAMAAWHGFGVPLALSAVALVGGIAVYAAQRAWERRGSAASPGTPAGAGYRAISAGVDIAAARLTAGTQRGSLPVSLGAILLVLVAFPGAMLVRAGASSASVMVTADPAQAVLEVLIVGVAVAVALARRGLTAVLLVGGVGYAVSVLFVLRGAPDLALTQLLVETVTLIAALLVLTRLPHDVVRATGRPGRFRLALALCVGALMTALALIIPGARRAESVSVGLGGPALARGGGHNVVNVILVDVRGWDTLGEISVLVAAGIGVASLVFLSRRPGSAPRRPADSQPPLDRPSPWLRTDWTPRRSLMLEVATRMIFHLMVIFSLYVLFVGHDAPGGGFAAGLIVGIALTLRYLAGGRFELGEAAPVDAGTMMGTGLILSGFTAAAGLIGGGAALQSTIWQADVPVLGHLGFVTSTVFDIGVYLVVIGLVLDVLHSLGAELDRQEHIAAGLGRPGQLAPGEPVDR